MAPKSPLCDSHRKWANSWLRSMLEAHYEDARRGGQGKSYSDLVDYAMKEYETMPFAKADFVEYLDKDGRQLFKEGELRKMARRYFHNHADPNKLATLEAFEASGGQSEPHPERALCASEIWAAGEKNRIQALTCADLQIASDTPAAKRPDGWLAARKKVVRREFDMLPEAEQACWEQEAQAQKASGKSRRAHPITVQQRQKQFFGELSNFIKKRMARGGLGERFVVVYQGFFIDPVAHRLSRFRGQQESFDVPKWHLSPGYDTWYKHWIGYIEPLIKNLISKDIDELPDGAVGAELASYRDELRKHFELLFKLTCGLQGALDGAQFWAEALDDPAEFVDPARLPPGTRFKNPTAMSEHDFVLIYRHIYECYWHPEAVDDDKRFIFEQAALYRYAAAERACLLQAATRPALAAAAADDLIGGVSVGGTSPANTSTVGASPSSLSVGKSTCGASADDASTDSASTNRARTGRASAGSASTDATLASGVSLDGTSTGGESTADGAGSEGARPARGRKRKTAPSADELEAAPTMAQQGYITRFAAERRSPPPKKAKVVKAKTAAAKPKPATPKLKPKSKPAAPKGSKAKRK